MKFTACPRVVKQHNAQYTVKLQQQQHGTLMLKDLQQTVRLSVDLKFN